MQTNFTASHWGFSLDAKHRVALPSDYREVMRQSCDTDRFKLVISPHGCLSGHPSEVWPEMMEMSQVWAADSPNGAIFRKAWLATAQDVKPDRHGRFVISEPLRNFAQLSGSVHWIGEVNRFELWDSRKWDQMIAGIDSPAMQQLYDQTALRFPVVSKRSS